MFQKTIFFRLDDFSHDKNHAMWDQILEVFDRHSVQVCIGVIPKNRDPSLNFADCISDSEFWSQVKNLDNSGHTVALHGLNHTYHEIDHGYLSELFVPCSSLSEFAGLSLFTQESKLKRSVECFHRHNVFPQVFMAPSHSFDATTLRAIKNVTSIKYITDGWSYRCFSHANLNFIPQQFGSLRSPLFSVNTYCIHPNTVDSNFASQLDDFITNYRDCIQSFSLCKSLTYPERDFKDALIHKISVFFRSIRALLFN